MRDADQATVPEQVGPAWAGTEGAIRRIVGRAGFSAYVGLDVETLEPGYCEMSVTRRPELLQRSGYLHGGCTATLVDTAASVAASTYLRPGQAVVTAEFKISYLAPARGERVLCRARVLKPGRTMSVVTCDVYSVENGVERHAATALATIAIVKIPEPSPAVPGATEPAMD